jgi:hypothetical protein
MRSPMGTLEALLNVISMSDNSFEDMRRGRLEGGDLGGGGAILYFLTGIGQILSRLQAKLS